MPLRARFVRLYPKASNGPKSSSSCNFISYPFWLNISAVPVFLAMMLIALSTLKPILLKSELDLLNITIRAVNRDHDAYLNYAREDVFGFVLLFNQKKTALQEADMYSLTNLLVDIAIKNGGTYYLPYRLHIAKDKMRKAYPQADSFFRTKTKYDPSELFNNKFYRHYK